MGKSIQGAGGAIVLGVVFHAFLSRSKITYQTNKNPGALAKRIFFRITKRFRNV